MEQRSYIKLQHSSSDRQIVETYEDVFAETVIGLEVTKPSEQAFKALITPHQRGGAILLFTEPVGRQEKDNLAFLEKHQLIPTVAEHEQLWRWAQDDLALKSASAARLLLKSKHWRGLRLPLGSAAAAKFTIWAKNSGLFRAMFDYKYGSDSKNELGSDGVEQFWDTVCHLLNK
jgi:hypothetical protein